MRKLIYLLFAIFIAATAYTQESESNLSKGVALGISFNSYTNTDGGIVLNAQSPIFAKLLKVDFSGGMVFINMIPKGGTEYRTFNAYPLTLGMSGSVDYKDIVRGSFGIGGAMVVSDKRITSELFYAMYLKIKAEIFLRKNFSIFIESNILGFDFTGDGSKGFKNDNPIPSPRYMEGFSTGIGFSIYLK